VKTEENAKGREKEIVKESTKLYYD